jgi:hypothetical protein
MLKSDKDRAKRRNQFQSCSVHALAGKVRWPCSGLEWVSPPESSGLRKEPRRRPSHVGIPSHGLRTSAQACRQTSHILRALCRNAPGLDHASAELLALSSGRCSLAFMSDSFPDHIAL